jgi:quinol monooxygenase YgiN
MKQSSRALGFAGVFALLSTCVVLGAVGRRSAPLAHIVVVELKDDSKETREAFVKSCHKYLSDHEGTLYYAVGTIADDVEEPVSDRAFDVVIHLVFESKDAEQKYLKDPRHVKFVEENGPRFGKVRVFDSYLTKPGGD